MNGSGAKSRLGARLKIEAVVFDIGETLIDETRVWTAWADWLGVPRFTFMAVLGGVIERGEDHREVFEAFRPGFDSAAAHAERAAAGTMIWFEAGDLYPDVPACLRELTAGGFRLAIAGNQPRGAEDVLNQIGLPVELVASSERWGVHKPSPAFFDRLSGELGLSPERIAYVGDRLDNDVMPARDAGMFSVFLKRGPCGYIHARRPEMELADLSIESLDPLPELLTARNAAHTEMEDHTQ
jgi:HAD superfamily hydrolase (TIGR01549 family)